MPESLEKIDRLTASSRHDTPKKPTITKRTRKVNARAICVLKELRWLREQLQTFIRERLF
jgi:hypothetical protein